MIRASIAALALVLSACGGGGSGGIEAPTAAQPAPGTTPDSAPAPSSTAPAPVPAPAPTATGLVAHAADVANTTLAGNQVIRGVGALEGGGHAVAWLSKDASGNAALFVQRYDASGAKAGAETRVDYTIAAQENPAIAVLRDGSIVVASVGSTPSASGTDWAVFARRFDANGGATGNDVVVATLTEAAPPGAARRFLAQPVLQALADGGVAIGWASVTQDAQGSVNALHAQRLDAQLDPAGSRVDFAANGVDANLALKFVPLPSGDFIAGTTHRFHGIPYVQFHVGTRDIGPLFDANAGLPELNTTLVPLADGRLALWSTGSAGGYMQMLDAAGRAMAPASAVTPVPESAAALPDGGWVAVTRQMPGLPNLAQRYDASGAPVGAAIEVAEGMSRPLPTTSMDNAFALAWTFTGAFGDADVRTQRIDAQ
jgi:hypothetical protein